MYGRFKNNDLTTKDFNSVMTAVTKKGMALQYVSETFKNNYDIVLAAVKQNGESLKYASHRLKNNYTIVFAAVTQNGYAFIYASDELKHNQDIVFESVNQFGRMLQHVPNILKNHHNIVLAAVTNYGYALEYASDALKDTELVVLQAVKNNPFSLQFASVRLKNCKDIVYEAMQKSVVSIIHASDGLRKDADIILYTIKQHNYFYLLKTCPKELSDNKEFLIKCYRINFLTRYHNDFIKEFDKLEHGNFNDTFIKTNYDILHLLTNKKVLYDYLIDKQMYNVIYNIEELHEYIKIKSNIIILSMNDIKIEEDSTDDDIKSEFRKQLHNYNVIFIS